MNKINTYLFILLGIILISIVLRFYQLGANPPSLDWDEASTGYNAYSILKTGNDEYGNFLPLSFRSFDDFKPPVYIYLTVLPVAFFGLTEFAVRFPAAAIGVLTVPVVYFLFQEICYDWERKKREFISLTTAFFIAISPWHLQFSRAAFEGNVGLFFLLLALLCFFKAFKNRWYYLGFSGSLILSMYSYHSFRLIDPLLLVVLPLLKGEGRGEVRNYRHSNTRPHPILLLKGEGKIYINNLKRKLYVLSLILIILSTLPIYISFLHPQGTGARLSMVTVFSDPALQKLSADRVALAKKQHDVFSEIIYNRRFIFIPEIIKGYTDHFNFSFLFLRGDGGVQHHAYNMGMLYLWDFPFILFGIFYLLKKRNRRILLVFFLFLLAPLPAAITTGTPHPVRAIAMIPAFQFFSAAGFVAFCLYFWRKKYFGKFLIAAAVLGLIINFAYYIYSYYALTPFHYGYFWQFGNKQAVQYAKEHEDIYQHIIMTYAYDQPYIYYLFYNKTDPRWYQNHWNYSGNGVMDRFYRKIGKYEFMSLTAKDLNRKNTLLIGTPQEIPFGTGVLKDTIKFPDGRIGYKIISL